MATHKCDVCYEYFDYVLIKNIQILIQLEEYKKVNALIFLNKFENFEIPDLCRKCFQEKVVKAFVDPTHEANND